MSDASSARSLALDTAAERFGSLLAPVWAPWAAPLLRLDREPHRVTFWLQFFEWEIALILETVEQLAAAGSKPELELLVTGWLRPRSLAARFANATKTVAMRDFDDRTLDGAVLLERVQLSPSSIDAGVERTLWNLKGALYAMPEVNVYLNRAITART